MMMISIFYRICTVCEKAVFLKSGVCVSDGEALLQELKASVQEKSSEFSLNKCSNMDRVHYFSQKIVFGLVI